MKELINSSRVKDSETYKRQITVKGLLIFQQCSKGAQRLYMQYLNRAWWSMSKPLETMLVDFDYKSEGYLKQHYYTYRRELIASDLISLYDGKVYVDIAYAQYFTNAARRELFKDPDAEPDTIEPTMYVPLPPLIK